MKYKKSFERDYYFYLTCISTDDFMFAGEDVTYRNFAIDGVSAKEAFYHLDSSGLHPPCREPVLVAFLLIAKKGINLQIKQWAEGIAELTLGKKELLSWLQELNAPSWVHSAVLNQAKKSKTKPITPEWTFKEDKND